MIKIPTIIKASCIIIIILFLNEKVEGQREFFLQVQAEAFQKINITIPGFKSNQNLDISNSIRDIISNDLELSGLFNVQTENLGLYWYIKDFKSLVSSPPVEGNSSVVFEGICSVNNNIISIDSKLYDGISQMSIMEKNYESEINFARHLAHQISDDIVLYLIGENGVANTKFAFVKKDQNNKEIAIMDYDGHGITQITNSQSLNLSPSWAPEGDKIIFTSYVLGNPDLMLFNLKQNKAEKLSREKYLHSAPAWSPDGKNIALTITKNGNADIYILNAANGKQTRITSNNAIDSSPSWAPNGREIAFTSDRSGNPQIYLMDMEGGNVRRLIFDSNYNDSPAWSPKGDRIAYVSREQNGFQIFTIDVNGEDNRRITDSPDDHENPCWSPNGLQLAFASTRSGKWNIYLVRWDGAEMRQLTKDGDFSSPKWSPLLN